MRTKSHLISLDDIEQKTSYDDDETQGLLSFESRPTVYFLHSHCTMLDRFPGNYDVEKFLEIFSEEDYDAFCLAYMFTYR